MINARVLIASAMITMSTTVVAMNTNNAVTDIRKFGLEFPHNKQDERKNTFWHKLAIESKDFDDWTQVEERIGSFKQNNKYWMPNPLIENVDGKTARKEAKASFSKTGNPICGLLVMYFKQTEDNYLNKVALKNNREDMVVMQKYEHPHK